MSEPVSDRAHYVTNGRDGAAGVRLVQQGRWEQPGPVRIVRRQPGTLRPAGRRAARRARRLVVAWIVALLGVCVVTALAWAEADSARCSLAWPEVTRNFGPGSGWRLVAPPVLLVTTDDGIPQYQAHLFESPAEIRMALVIAEWGDPQSPRLGPVVYCTIRSAQGAVVEELGRNPMGVETSPTACLQCV